MPDNTPHNTTYTKKQLLDKAARLALRAQGDVEPNPIVGCVIAKPINPEPFNTNPTQQRAATVRERAKPISKAFHKSFTHF